MRQSIFILVLLHLVSCNSQNNQLQLLQRRTDSLQNELKNTYKPGFGEFMSSIQVHHNKLWFAGINNNWKLADFEVHEIMETLDDIKNYQSERKESRELSMLLPALDTVNNAIQQKNLGQFKAAYVLLTNTCNQCHKSNDFEYNVIKIPDNPPFSNQDFVTH